MPFPLNDPRCRLFRRARHGLWLALRAAGIVAGDEALAPAYHHGSEIEALIQAGLTCKFYEATETLEPDEAELERLLTPRTKVLHLTHYLGLPQNARRWRRWCDERGLLLIEDAAMAWLATRDDRPVGSDGDIAIYCLYKTFGVPDGGALLSRFDVPASKVERRLAITDLAFVHALSLLRRSSLLSRLALVARKERPYLAKSEFALGDPVSAPSTATLLALPHVVDVAAAEKRRRNFRQLQSALSEMVSTAFRAPAPGACPFVFPIETDDKPALLARLHQRGIRGYDLWPLPHDALRAEEFPRTSELRRRAVGLPVHQELRPQDLSRIVSAVRGD
jgi:dTDP-4-amino-4,6-dideoxygalactose transaminase